MLNILRKWKKSRFSISNLSANKYVDQNLHVQNFLYFSYAFILLKNCLHRKKNGCVNFKMLFSNQYSVQNIQANWRI